MLDAAYKFLDVFWSSFLLLSPMLLLGLFLAGLIHVLISRAAILRWLSGDSLKSVCTSAAVGVPVPLCSCSVVPVVIEMRKKGASRSSCVSFLITAPETGADSILVTHAFFGFVAAVVRPAVSFITAVVTGIFCIGLVRDEGPERNEGATRDHAHGKNECGHDHGGCDHSHADPSHGHHAHEPLMAASNDCYVSPSQLKEIVLQWFRGLTRSGDMSRTARKAVPDADAVKGSSPVTQADGVAGDAEGESPSLGKVVKHVLRYGFVEVADDILFALVVGIAIGGALFLAVPDDLMTSEYARWLSYPAMVLVGIPLYICASASTPIAAALVAKGLSPGAALILLMTGPATNTGTIAVIVRQFGARFGSIYVGGVIAVTTVLAVAIDATVIFMGLALPVNLSASELPALQVLEWASAFALLALIAWRLSARLFRPSLASSHSHSAG